MVDFSMVSSITREPTVAERIAHHAWKWHGIGATVDETPAEPPPDFYIKHPYVTAVIEACADIRTARPPLFDDYALYTWVFDMVLEHAYSTFEIDGMMRAMARA